MQTMTATYSPEDNKLRLYSVGRLDAETYARVKAAGFRWAPKQDLWVAPAWSPGREDLLTELCGEVGDEDTSLVDRAAERAERFAEYHEHRTRDAERAERAVREIADNIPFGQPILVGHHSEKHARRDAEKIDNGMRRAVRMWETAAYWTDRAAGALRHAKYKERPDVRARRIKGLEADVRRFEKTKAESERWASLWSRLEDDSAWKPAADGTPRPLRDRALAIANHEGVSKCWLASEYPRPEGMHVYEGMQSTWSALSDGFATVEQVREVSLRVHGRTIAKCDRWLAHLANRLAYERAMLAEGGGLAADAFDFQPGGRVTGRRRGEVATVLRVNRKGGAVVSVTTNARYCHVWNVEDIKAYEPPTAEAAAAVAKATKLPPMTNYPDGAEPMTRAEWDEKHKDYKSSRAVEGDGFARHRRRTAVIRGRLCVVYLTDDPRKDPPKAEPAPEPDAPAVPPSERAPWPTRSRTPDVARERAAELAGAIKGGVQVVSVPQLFETPPDVVARMLEVAELRAQHTVLEPSAGTGRITHALFNRGVARLVAVDVATACAEWLRAAQAFHPDRLANQVRHADFLACTVDDLGRFDRILMNPPFENGADIKHVLHARGFLKPGGVLVGICAGGPRQAEKLRPLCDTWEELPPDTFRGTSVRAVLFRMRAPDAAPAPTSGPSQPSLFGEAAAE